MKRPEADIQETIEAMRTLDTPSEMRIPILLEIGIEVLLDIRELLDTIDTRICGLEELVDRRTR